MRRIIIILCILILAGCTWNVPVVKQVGPGYLKQMGFEVIGYEGYQWGFFGGKVWYLVTPADGTKAKYSVYLIKRRGEIQLYKGSDWANQKEIDLRNVE